MCAASRTEDWVTRLSTQWNAPRSSSPFLKRTPHPWARFRSHPPALPAREEAAGGQTPQSRWGAAAPSPCSWGKLCLLIAFSTSSSSPVTPELVQIWKQKEPALLSSICSKALGMLKTQRSINGWLFSTFNSRVWPGHGRKTYTFCLSFWRKAIPILSLINDDLRSLRKVFLL